MSDEDRRNRSDRLKRRFEQKETEAPDVESEREMTEMSKKSKTGEMAKTDKRDMTEQTDETEQLGEGPEAESVKNRPSVLMYLPEEIHEELDIRFDELNARHKRVHGEKLEKNRDYYPAVVKAGLESDDLEGVLDI